MAAKKRGLLFIVSAPSGAGKSTLAKAIAAHDKRFSHPVSYTTRQPRPGEINGKDYHFVNMADFENLSRRGCFLERAQVHGAHYATSKNGVEKTLKRGRHALLTVDVQGARAIHGAYPKEAVRVFLLPPSKKVWRERLQKRGERDIGKRMAAAEIELQERPNYDYCLINDRLDHALKDFFSIVRAEELKVKSNAPRLGA